MTCAAYARACLAAFALGALSLGGIVACCSCPKPTGPVAPAKDGSVEALACFNLRSNGCPEGDPAPVPGDTCEQTLARHDARFSFDVKCIADARGVDEIRKCPNVRCAAR